MYYFPMDSVVTFDENNIPSFDRAISSEIYRKLLEKMYTTGVPKESNDFIVSPSEGLSVLVQPGFAIVRGCLTMEVQVRTLVLQASDNNYPRIDTVVLRLNTLEDARSCDLYVLTGTPATTPREPDLTRNDSVYEYGLANIYIPAGSSSISSERITDTRYDALRGGTLLVNAAIEVDSTLSMTTNPVQNKVVTASLNKVKEKLNCTVDRFDSTTGTLYLKSVNIQY